MDWLVVFVFSLSCAYCSLLGGYNRIANDERAVESRLKNDRIGRNLLGGQERVLLKEEIDGPVQDAVDVAVEKINSMSNDMFRVVDEDVFNITKQIVAGVLYKFTVQIASTGCVKSSHENLGKCQVSADARRTHCYVEVYGKPTHGKMAYELKKKPQCSPVSRSQRAAPSPRLFGAADHHLLGGGDHDCHVHLQAFRQFQKDHKRLYATQEEEAYRFKTFCDNMKRIKVLQDQEQGSAIYKVNHLADISEAEFRKHYLTPEWDLKTSRPWMTPAAPANPSNSPVPDNWDWRDHGAVTPVKNQGSCGSCWAFSTTGNIEGQWKVKSGHLVSLSEQELVDCDKLDEGCNGGLPSNAYEAIMKIGGIESESQYKYDGVGEKCKFNRSKVAVKINGAVNISSDEEEMKAWLYKNGPISIGINAFAMQFYWGGIAHPWKVFCNPSSLDHGVLIVGYGVSDKGEPYWIIKNSWGPGWGEKGYYLVYRGSGVCGLNQMCTSAQIN